MPDIEIEKYIQGVWVQIKPDRSLEFYKPIDCLEVYSGKVDNYFYDQVHDMKCADMRGDSIKLQNQGKAKNDEDRSG